MIIFNNRENITREPTDIRTYTHTSARSLAAFATPRSTISIDIFCLDLPNVKQWNYWHIHMVTANADDGYNHQYCLTSTYLSWTFNYV